MAGREAGGLGTAPKDGLQDGTFQTTYVGRLSIS